MKSVFMICPIGHRDSKERRRADNLLQHLINPALRERGLEEAVRADRIAEPGQIPAQVVQHLIENDLVIADLHGDNPNVFYELGIRHTTGRPCIQIAEEGDQLPFDVYGVRTIFTKSDDVGLWHEAKNQLSEHIGRLQERQEPFDTLVTQAFDLLRLRRNQGLLDVFQMMEPTRPIRHLIRDACRRGLKWSDLEPDDLALVDDLCRKLDTLGVYDRLGLVNSLHVDVFYGPPIVELYEAFLEDYVANQRSDENRGPRHYWELVQLYKRVQHVPSNHPAVTGGSDWPDEPRRPARSQTQSDAKRLE